MRSLFRILVVAAALLFGCLDLYGADLKVARNSNLRPTPDTSGDPIRMVKPPARVTLLEAKATNGYYHVRAGTDEGWLYAKNLKAIKGRSQKTFAARALGAKKKGTGPCAPDLAHCQAFGCETKGSAHAHLNERKRTVPTGDSPVTLTFEQLQALQEETDNRGIHGGDDLTAKQRKQLADFDLGGTHVGEGALIQIAGFIAPLRKLREADPESVNCRLPNGEDNDIHVPIVNDPEGTEFESIVVEPIPEHQIGITVPILRQLQKDGTKLLIQGQLMLDNAHLVNDNPEHPQGSQPRRFTIWEVHPVTALLACSKPENDCDPGDLSQWVPASE